MERLRQLLATKFRLAPASGRRDATVACGGADGPAGALAVVDEARDGSPSPATKVKAPRRPIGGRALYGWKPERMLEAVTLVLEVVA